MEGQPQLPGAEWFKGDFRRSDAFTKGAQRFTEAQGREYTHPDEFAATRADPNQIMAIGKVVRQQQGSPQHLSPQLHESYQHLHAGIEQQYEHLTRPEHEGGMGISVEVSAEDPYSDPMEMRHDVETNKRLKVLATETGSGNIAMPEDINNKFRAVHDAFGHLATGRNFARHGEEAAAQHHAQMFPPEAHAALFSETRGQNSALIRSGSFPEQKGYELPDWAKEVRPTLPGT